MTHLTVYSLGLLDYQQAFMLQDKLLEERIAGKVSDCLLLLEHPPTLTLGREDDKRNLLIPETALRNRGIAICPTDRGGSITWHGPGQLVAYPIIDLGDQDRDIHRYIRSLEEVIIRTLRTFSVSGIRDEENVGVWVGGEKIAAIGVKVRKWVTKHGFSINVNSDLSDFSLINPCGLTDKGVTSLAKRLSREVPMAEVRDAVIHHFGTVFGMSVTLGTGLGGEYGGMLYKRGSSLI